MNIQTTILSSKWLTPPGSGYFSQEQAEQLDAVFARILPADPARGIPGARGVGAVDFVSQLLAMRDDVYFEIEGWRLAYPPALRGLDRYCGQTHGKKLVELDDTGVNALISSLEMGQLSGFSIADELAALDPATLDRMKQLVSQGRLTLLSLVDDQLEISQSVLFKTLWRHCLQGCFADPRWGGNKDKVMWRAMGYLQQPEDNLA